jgi:methylaspartate ammonia-lyase
MKVQRVLITEGFGGFFYDDQAAIRAGAVLDGESYRGTPRTPGFAAVRIPGRAVSVGLVLADGYIAWGDCVNVQYAAAAGRDPLVTSPQAQGQLRECIVPWLSERAIGSFRSAVAELAALRAEERPLNTAIRYGVSQALLDAAAHAARRHPVALLREEYALDDPLAIIPIHAQTGDDRQRAVDRMIMKRIESMPHGLFNAPEKFGRAGEKFVEYLRWVRARIRELAGEAYRPILHFDLYGTPGLAFDNAPRRIAEFLASLVPLADGLTLRIEAPADFGSRQAQIDRFVSIRGELRRLGSPVQIVVDEWCNTLEDIADFAAAGAADVIQIKTPDLGEISASLEAVLACRRHGAGAYLGGSAAETDLSSRASTHVAMATRADVQLAKPGMGVDEGIMLVRNEQLRTLAALA